MPSRRRVQEPAYRIEWRVLTGSRRAHCDVRFETAGDPAVLVEKALTVGAGALSGEFRLITPAGGGIFTTADRLLGWDPDIQALPRADENSLWKTELDRLVKVDAVMAQTRQALRGGMDEGLLSMRQMLLVLAAVRSVLRRTVG